MSKKLRGNLLLLLTALIWGSSFVSQSVGMDFVGPFTFNGIRTLLGGFVLIPVILIMGNVKKRNQLIRRDCEPSFQEIGSQLAKEKAERKTLIIGGICCGVILFIAGSLQQIGIQYTTAGKAGFITALYIVLVPILGLFIGKKVRPIVWICVLISAIGLYLLCIKDGFSIAWGDTLIILCAFFFAIHILVIDHFSPKVDGVKMSCIQFFIAGGISLIPMVLFESPDILAILKCWLPILYSGVLSCGVAYTLQIVGQKDTEPAIASLILSLESVFAVLAGFIILHELMSVKELIGCVMMFVAIILAQMPAPTKVEKIKGELK